MKLFAAIVFTMCCVALSYSNFIRPTSDKSCDSIQTQVQNALNNNNPAKAIRLLNQYSCQMKDDICSVENEPFRRNLMKSVNLFDRRLRQLKPDKHCSCDDIKKFAESTLLYPEVVAGFFTGFTLGPIGLLVGGVEGARRTSLSRLKCGNYAGAVTGLLVGLIYGAEYGYVYGFFYGFPIPVATLNNGKNEHYVCDENCNENCDQNGDENCNDNCDKNCYENCAPNRNSESFYSKMRTALDNNDSCRATKLFREHSCELRQRCRDARDEEFRRTMIRTVDLLDENIKAQEPDECCSCDDMRDTFNGVLLGIKLITGFTLGAAPSPVIGAIGFVREGLETAKYRLCDGNLPGAVTGFFAGGAHGLTQTALTQFYSGLGYPLRKC